MNFFALIIILAALFLFFILGKFVLFLVNFKVRDDLFYDVFVNLIIGMFLSTIIYAIIVSKANTVLWGVVLVGGLFLFTAKNNTTDNQKIQWKSMFNKAWLLKSFSLLFFIGLFFFFVYAWFFYHQPFNYLPHGDYSYYVNIIQLLNTTGIESTNVSNYIFSDVALHPAPYHYPEMWLTAFLSRFSGILIMETMVVVSTTVLNTILSIGMIALTRLFTKQIIIQFFAVFSVYISGLLLFEVLPQAPSYVYAIGWTPKTMFVGLFLIWFVILTIKKSEWFYFPIICLPIINISLAPAILSAFGIIGLFAFIRKPILKYNRFLLLLSTFLVGLFIALFYYLNANTSAAGNFTLDNILIGHSYDMYKSVKIFAGSLIILSSLYVLYFIPIGFMLFTKQRRVLLNKITNLKPLLFIFLNIAFVGMFFWGLTHPISDSMQFFYMPAVLLFNIIVFVFLLMTLSIFNSNKTIFKYIITTCFIVLILANIVLMKDAPFYQKQSVTSSYSTEFIEAVFENIEQNENGNYYFASIRKPEDIKGFWSAISSGKYSFLYLFSNDFYFVSLDPLSVNLSQFEPIERNRVLSNYENKPFYKYAQNLKSQNDTLSTTEIQYKFVIDKKIKHLIINDENMLDYRFIQIADTIIKDKKSECLFVKLDF